VRHGIGDDSRVFTSIANTPTGALTTGADIVEEIRR
jgi:hypothetical protein